MHSTSSVGSMDSFHLFQLPFLEVAEYAPMGESPLEICWDSERQLGQLHSQGKQPDDDYKQVYVWMITRKASSDIQQR